MVLICPSCGAARKRLKKSKKTPGYRKCRDCGHKAKRAEFTRGGPGEPRSANQAWRDGSTMSMDGQDGERPIELCMEEGEDLKAAFMRPARAYAIGTCTPFERIDGELRP